MLVDIGKIVSGDMTSYKDGILTIDKNIYKKMHDLLNISPSLGIKMLNMIKTYHTRGKGTDIAAAENYIEQLAEVGLSKEEAIALMAAQRDAVLLVTTLINSDTRKPDTEDDLKMEIVKWRNWFLSDDFKEHPPF